MADPLLPSTNPYPVTTPQQAPTVLPNPYANVSTNPASPSSGTSWWSKMSPEAQGALINAGAQIGGGLLTGMGQDKQNQANLDFQYAQLHQQAADSAAQRTIQAAQSNPLAIQAQRQKMAVMGAILPGLRNVSVTSNIPGMNSFIPQITGGFRLPEGGLPQNVLDFYSPQSVANAEGEFWKQMAGSVVPQDLTKVGYGAAGQQGTDTAMAARQQAIANATSPMGSSGQGLQEGTMATEAQTKMTPAPHGYKWAPAGFDGLTQQKMFKLEKDSGGFWHTLGKIGLIAGGALAMPFVGPLGGAMIGAGVGAGESALNGGGWKGALMGAGLGGLTGGFAAGAGGPAAQAVSGVQRGIQGAGSTIEHALFNPSTLTQMAGQLPGPAGQVAGLASNFLPGGGGGASGIVQGDNPEWDQWLQRILQLPGTTAGGQGGQPNWMQIIQMLMQMRQPLYQGPMSGQRFPGGGIS